MRAFSLIEIIVVVAIIGILLSLIAPLTSSAVADAQFRAAEMKVKGMLQLARARAKSEMTSFGVFFYVDHSTKKQGAVFIRWGGQPPVEVQHGIYAGAYWNRYASRFETVPEGNYMFPASVRVRGSQKRNVFAIIFSPSGTRDVMPVGFRYVLYDYDEDDSGRGDVTNLPVSDITGSWYVYSDASDPDSRYKRFDLKSGLPIEDMVDLDGSAGDWPYTEFEGAWGLIVYDHAAWTSLLVPDGTGEFDDAEAEAYLAREVPQLLLTRNGDIVKGNKSE